VEEAVAGADVLIVANNHRAYKSWDISALTAQMNKPAIIYDGWRMLDKSFIKTLPDVSYMGVGV
jgi:UDP-N-acetyl-D-mannosaminuronate dehydrogenase